MGTQVLLNLDLISGMKYVYLLTENSLRKSASFGSYLDNSRSAYIHITELMGQGRCSL